jgi:diguanylate cyclase (GGDEF)-like protein
MEKTPLTSNSTAERDAALSSYLLPLGPVRAWLFISCVAVLSAGVWAYDIASFEPLTGALTLEWWQLAIAFYVAEVYVVHLQFRKQAHTLSMTEFGLVVGLFFASPAALFAAQFIGAGVALSVHRRQKPMKLAFNLAELPLCSGIALLIFRSYYDGDPYAMRTWALVLFAAAVAHIVGVLLVSAVIAVVEARLTTSQLPQTLAISLVGALAAASIGLAGVLLTEARAEAGLLLLLPALTCALAFRAYMKQREQQEHLEFLYESMRATHGAPEFGLAVGQLLVAARRLLRADYAEILLIAPTPREPALRSVSGGAGETLMHSMELSRLDRHALESLGAADRALVLSRRRDEDPLDGFLAARKLDDAIIGALRGEERLFGLLLVGDRMGDVGTFAETDRELFQTFAGHASVLLENGRLEHSLAQVTELKEELRHQAYHDALTGLPNRALFADRVAETLTSLPAGPGHAILFLDLDRFKNVNDTWGHSAGDELLTEVAERIRSILRPGDTAARLGGDEFAVLLEDTDVKGAERAAQRLCDTLEASFTIDGRETRLHVSIGVAVTKDRAETAEELIRNADIAMYAAKGDDARRWIVYEPVLHTRMRHQRRLALELESAIERGELVVEYQPIVSLADGTIHAFEALVRWRHPERGLLLPVDFLAAAEDSGLMVEIGTSVLEQAFRSAGHWQDAVPNAAEIGISINLSPSELVSERLAEDLALALTRTRLDPRRLTIEITESTMIRDEQRTLAAMRRLREFGVRLCIDDFGTGYSSLSRLSDLPIEMLKIPKTFIDQLASEDHDASFVDAILRLAGSLGVVTVAEGIEHAVQARKVRELGCGLGQGNLISRPLPEDEVFRLLRATPSASGAPSIPAARTLALAPEEPPAARPRPWRPADTAA